MKKLNHILVSIAFFLVSYLFDLIYLPVYIGITCFLCYSYAMVSEVLSVPFIMPLWKLFLLALGVIFFVISTVLNIIAIKKVSERFKKVSERKEED